MRVRHASHAGSWYSDDREVLDGQLHEWLNDAQENTPNGKATTIRAIIAPHAGFRYSGPTAAHAYHQIRELEHIKRVFILGPSHHFYLKGCAVSTATDYQTPLGNIPIDQEVTEQLMNSGKFVTMTLDADEDEHSIEMHLPFIVKVMNGRKFTAVPILVGDTKFKTDAEYGKILAPYFEDDQNLFVISSDFCHWGSRFRFQPHDSTFGEIHKYIEHLDHEGMELIERLDARGFADYLERTGNTICGRHPIAVLLHTINTTQNTKFTLKFVKYAQSSACKRHSDSSVSYASAIIYHNP
ncbi:TPA: hypothetical protein N0F65_008983 [Lagenidium giganteum]|uniref:Memo-like protein n=1 Tax=Lagenidium giganteum TaxID=4803 RepID=A0AAV2YLA6_9STRA|nr:TPA: hypothetical protein N0F65_008983 [Lagenidium giganteum]